MYTCVYTLYCESYVILFAMCLSTQCRNGLVDNMRYLSRSKEEYGDVQIPLSVLE